MRAACMGDGVGWAGWVCRGVCGGGEKEVCECVQAGGVGK